MLDRVVRGEVLVVTRDGAEVGELRPRLRPRLSATDLIARRPSLPVVDVGQLQRDVDATVDQTL